MKFIKYGIGVCVFIIAFNLVLGLSSSMNDNYDPRQAERIAQFAIVLIPLVVIFLVAIIGKAVFRRMTR
jgi:hypothetical protein